SAGAGCRTHRAPPLESDASTHASLGDRRMNVRAKLPTLLAAAAAMQAFSIDVAHAQAGERQTLRGERIAIYNLAGSIRVEGGSGPDVTVVVERKGSDGGRLEVATGAI